MNKKNMQQLKAAIARDLVRGQGEHSPTKELLKQYVPLEGIITPPAPEPVENTMALRAPSSAPHATVVPDAAVAGDAGVALYATVKGELRVPNTINFSLFPTLDPFAKAVYYQLFLLSHGFQRHTCIIGCSKLAKSVVMSKRKFQETITYLEKRGLIKRLRSILGGPSKGNVYRVFLPATATASGTTVARGATNNYDDDLKIKSSSNSEKHRQSAEFVENHSGAAAPRERKENSDETFLLVRAAYEKATGNRWNRANSEVYRQNGIGKVSTEKIIASMEAVVRRTLTKINSFRYFVKEILVLPDPMTPSNDPLINSVADRFSSSPDVVNYLDNYFWPMGMINERTPRNIPLNPAIST